MRSKILLALAGLPSRGNHGGAQTCLGIILGLKKKYDIEILSFIEDDQYLNEKVKNEKFLNKNNIKINYINISSTAQNKISRFEIIKNFLKPDVKTWYKWAKYSIVANKLVNKINPDVILCYHYEPLAALYQSNFKIIALMGDPTQELFKNSLILKKNNFLTKFIKQIQYMVIKSILDRIFIKLTKKCEKVLFFAFQYVGWSKKIGVNSSYLRTPLYDDFKSKRKKQKIFTILMIGDLSGTVTKTGLDIFFKFIFPKLNLIIGKENFIVNIVGRNNNYYKKKYNKFQNIKFLGKIEPADYLFLNSDILLTPNNLSLGIRVRIITALGHSCPVITHVANLKGIPELKNKYNSMVSNSPNGLVNSILKLYKDEKLKKKISINGKYTFNSFFSHKHVLKNLSKYL